MTEPGANHETHALSPRALRLRDSCIGALSRRSSLRPPTPTELSKIRDTLGLPEAWYWWSHLDTPTEFVRTIPRRSLRRMRRRALRGAIITVLATGAWLMLPIAIAAALPSRFL